MKRKNGWIFCSPICNNVLSCTISSVARGGGAGGRAWWKIENSPPPLPRKLGAEVVKWMSWLSVWKRLHLRFWPKNQSQFWWRPFLFFSFWRPLVFGLKNVCFFELSEKFRLNFRTNSVILIQEQWKFGLVSFALFSLFQKSLPPFPNPGYAPVHNYGFLNPHTKHKFELVDNFF